MAIERFRRSGASQFAQIPSIDPIGAREAARTGQAFAQAMDRVSRFAMQVGQEEIRERAQTEGAQIVEEKGARGALAEIAEQGGPRNLTEEVAFELANRVATAEVETDARSTMSQLYTDAELNKTSYEDFQAQIDDVVLGYTSALEEFDPESAVVARQRLEEVAATNLNRYAETWQKGQASEVLARSIAGVEQRKRDVIDAALEDSELSEEETEKRIGDLRQYMEDNFWDQSAIEETVLDLQEDITKERILYDFRNIEGVEEKRAYIENLRENPPELLGEAGTRTMARALRADLASQETEINSRSRIVSGKIDNEILDVVTAGGDPGEEKVIGIVQEAQATGNEEVIAEAQRAVRLREDILTLRRMPPAQLEAFINEERSTGIDNPYEVEVIEQAERLLANIQTQAEKDPLSLGAELGLIELNPISEGDDVTEAIRQRVDAAELMADHFGVTPKYLTAAEAAQTVNQIKQLNPLEKANLALGMNEMPPGVFSQIAENNEPTFAMVSAIGDLNIGLAVFEGEALIRDNLVQMPNREELRTVFNETVGDVYGERDRQAVLAAAKGYYAYAATDRNDFDEDEFKQAIQTVTGGITEINGSKVQLPRDVDADTFEDFVNRFTPEMVKKFGGVQNLTNEEAAEAIQDLQLESDADGVYFVLQAGAPLMNKQGEPFTIVWDDTIRGMMPGPRMSTRSAVRRSRGIPSEQDDTQDRQPSTRAQVRARQEAAE